MFTTAMGWLRLVGSLKLQVSFAENGLFYRALLQKRPIILRILRIVSTSYRAAAQGEGGTVLAEILETQLATLYTIWNDYTLDFWEKSGLSK